MNHCMFFRLSTCTHHVFEDERQRRLCVYDVVQGDDVGVFELLEQRGLPDGREGGALLLLKTDLLQGDDLVRKALKRERKSAYKWAYTVL